MNKAAPAKQPPAELIQQLQMALKFQKDGMFTEADNAYKKALKDYPDFPDALHLAAIFYEQIGKTKYAITLLNKALQLKKNDLGLLKLLAHAHFKEGDYPAALQAAERARLINPNDGEALYLLGLCNYKRANTKSAYDFLNHAWENGNILSANIKKELIKRLVELALEGKDYARAKNLVREAENLKFIDYEFLIRASVAHLEKPIEAFEYCFKAIKSAPQRDEAKSLLSFLCQTCGTPVLKDTHLEKIIMPCLESNKVKHQNLSYLWVQDFFSPKNAQAIAILKCKSYEEFVEKFDFAKEQFLNPYFIKSLKLIFAETIETERLYTFLRRHYFEMATGGKIISAQEMELVIALTQQCHLNEYVFSVSHDERKALELLGKELQNAGHFSDKHILKILAYCCYKPLVMLGSKADFDKLPDLTEVVKTQITDYEEERKIGKTIPTLSPISDSISLAVQNQYEENPYPRWNAPTILMPFSVEYADHSLHKPKDILIAGCGTGQHIFVAKNHHLNARITAIDLSRASLSYAKRKLKEYGHDKEIELYHADILDVGRLNKTFDYIECMGVLHHMEAPEKGLQALLKVLKPGGKIKLGLYSALARRNVSAAREYISEQKLKPDASGLQQAREHLKDLDYSNLDFNPVYLWSDFYSSSGCRDLIFHVQEHTYTIPKIAQLLNQNGLEFSGFYISENRIEKLKEKYNNINHNNDLDIWHKYELEYPDTFISMYCFFAVKK